MKQEILPGTQSVRRAVALLKGFTAEQPQRGLAELSRQLRLNKTTAFRLLQALEAEGLVARTADGEAYQLGPELITLAARAHGSQELKAAARPELEELARVTRETASLEVLVGLDALVLDEALGGYMVGARPSVGARWPAHAASTGKVLLAHLPDERRQALGAATWPALTPRTVTGATRLARALAKVREQGYATALEELEPGYVAVGAPVRDASGAVVAALSVGGPKARLGADRLRACTKQVVAAARRVSARLGHGASGRPPLRLAAGEGRSR
jgi:IclR family acetate operon transcriptional repressor